jgi:hypothetical protein
VAVYRSEFVSRGKALCSAVLPQYGRFVHSWRFVWLQDGIFGVPGLLNRLRPTLPADDYDWRIYEAVCDNHHRSQVDFRNANSRVLSGFDEGDYGSLDVGNLRYSIVAIFYYRGNRHTHGRPLKHVPFRRSDGCALRHQYGSGLAGHSNRERGAGSI